ncbi:MAG: DUF1573 domain-containing protein [Flavobacteriales bacterium]|nr:DUF1573 domain-containing protein [Flavobacteriales bacterium]
MKRIVLSVAVVGMLFASCGEEQKELSTDIVANDATAEEGVTNTAMPKMKFEKDLFDFGKISQGEKVSFSYTFKNTGDADLVITSAQGSCGCTVPTWPKEPIKAGETGTIDVVFDSNGKSGKQHKKVTIVANTTPATNVVALTGSVVAPEEK